MKTKILIASFVIASSVSSVQADFIGDLSSNISVDSGFQNEISTDTISDFAQNYASGYISNYTSSTLSSFLDSFNSNFSSSMMQMCYVYEPTTETNNYNSDICSLLENETIDLCSPLPATIGPYTKKSSVDQANIQLNLKSWCNNFIETDSTTKTDLVTSSKNATMSGLTHKQIKQVVFFGEEQAAIQAKKKELKEKYEAYRTSPASQRKSNSLGNAAEELNQAGEGAAMRAFLHSNSKTTTEGELDPTSTTVPKLPYDSQEEYDKDVESLTMQIVAVSRELQYRKHIDVAKAKFETLNNVYVYSVTSPPTSNFSTLDTEKDTWINEYLAGYKTTAEKWAFSMAEREILYQLYKDSSDSSLNFSSTGKRIKGNSSSETAQIISQSHNLKTKAISEASIYIKYYLQADQKVEELRRAMERNKIVSRPFNYVAAQAEIEALLSN